MSILKVSHIKKDYFSKNNQFKVLKDVNFFLDEKQFVGVMGPSGSGKTTLLNIISTIDRATGGNIEISGESIINMNEDELCEFRRKNLGFIFQDFNLLDILTIKENIALALTINEYDSINIDNQITKLAKKLGIEHALEKFPYEVSGGEKQRCACARAIITNPKLILADEPTGALDSNASKKLLEMMKDVNREFATSILMVTHDASAASYCDRVIFIKDGFIFDELVKKQEDRKVFYEKIVSTMIQLEEGNGQCT